MFRLDQLRVVLLRARLLRNRMEADHGPEKARSAALAGRHKSYLVEPGLRASLPLQADSHRLALSTGRTVGHHGATGEQQSGLEHRTAGADREPPGRWRSDR